MEQLDSVQSIDTRIAELRRELCELQQRRREAIARERAGERQRETACAVLAEFERGNEIVVSNTGPWWHQHGELIRRATADELQAAEHLARAGAVERDSR